MPLSFYEDLIRVYIQDMVYGDRDVFLHLKMLVGAKREVGASLFLPPLVCKEGVTDYV